MHLRFSSCDLRLSTRPTQRRGFSFTEILFAVMILGIGFIMVAAMFPVAIQQTQTSSDETVGAALAREGVSYMAQAVASRSWPPISVAAFPQTSILTPTLVNKDKTIVPESYPNLSLYPVGTTITLNEAMWSCFDTSVGKYSDAQTVNNPNPPPSQFVHKLDLWMTVSPNMIQASDPRYAWVAFYKRDYGLTKTFLPGANPFSKKPYAQVIAIAVRARNTQTYSPSDLVPSNTGFEPSLIPSPGTATFGVSQQLPDGTVLNPTITIDAASNAAARAVEGAFVVISSDNLDPSQLLHGQLNGHVYRIGVARPDVSATSWEFGPGDGPTAGDAAVINAMGTTFNIYIIGRGADPNNPGQYIGPAQDIGIYSTFVACPN